MLRDKTTKSIIESMKEIYKNEEVELNEKVTDNGDGTETVVTKSIGADGIPSTSTVRRRKEGNPMDPHDLKMLKTARMSHGTHHGEVKEDTELDEGKMDWIKDTFAEVEKSSKKKSRPTTSDEWEPAKHTAAEKETNKAKAQTQRASELVGKAAKKVAGKSYGGSASVVIDHEHEHPAGMPDKHPQHAASPELMKMFGLHVRTSKAIAPARPKGKAATPEAMKAYRKALQAHLKESDDLEEQAKWRQQTNRPTGPGLGKTFVKTVTDYGDRVMKEPIGRAGLDADSEPIEKNDPLQSRKDAKLNLSTRGLKLTTKNAQRNLKHNIIDTIGHHGKSNLPESAEQLDELSFGTLLRTKERGDHLAKVGAAHKAKDEKMGAAYEKYGKKLSKKVTDHIQKGYFTKEEVELDEAKVGTETNGSSDNARSFARKGTGDPKQELATKFNAVTDGDINKCKAMLGSDAKNLPESFDGDAAMRNDNYSHSSENRAVAPKKVKKIGLFNKTGQHVRSYHETEVAKAKAHAQSGGFTMKRVEEEVENIFDVNIVKEGFQYYYDILFEDEVLAEGVASTEAGAHAQINRFVESLIEEAINEENQIDRVKNIINKYIK